MKEEIFGPVLPVIIVKSRQEAINFIQQQVSEMMREKYIGICGC
jgi:acyl-CoA reductase-like NAD-dependent aldehyde dehydrogenase